MSNDYECSTCAKTFMTQGLRNRHELIHSNEKAFECEICSKSFRRKGHLNQHLPVHFKNYGLSKFDIISMPLNVLCLQYKPIVKPKDFTCKICEKIFNGRQQLRSHMFKHSLFYKYCCGICTKSFKRAEALRQHFFKLHREHYNDYKDYSYQDEMNFAPAVVGKKFVCDICCKHFTTKESVRVHMTIHMNLKPFVCEVCSKGFRGLRQLKKHYKTHSGSAYTMVGVKNEKDTDGLNSYKYETENTTDPKLFNCKVVLTRCVISIIVKEEPIIVKQEPIF